MAARVRETVTITIGGELSLDDEAALARIRNRLITEKGASMKPEEQQTAQELGRLTGEIKMHMGVAIFCNALVGSGTRALVKMGLRDRAIESLGGDELLVQRQIRTVERLEELVGSGVALHSAIDTMILEGYAEVAL